MVLLGLVALGGCGFAPVYGPGGPGRRLRNAVLVAAPETPEGFRLRAELEDRLGWSETASFVLTVTLDVGLEPVAITTEGATTRYNLPGEAKWVLTDAATGDELASGTEQAFTAYSAAGNTLATRASERDARDRLSIMLADQIVTQLLAAMSGGAA